MTLDLHARVVGDSSCPGEARGGVTNGQPPAHERCWGSRRLPQRGYAMPVYQRVVRSVAAKYRNSRLEVCYYNGSLLWKFSAR
jgi:hypothetical protein